MPHFLGTSLRLKPGWFGRFTQRAHTGCTMAPNHNVSRRFGGCRPPHCIGTGHDIDIQPHQAAQRHGFGRRCRHSSA